MVPDINFIKQSFNQFNSQIFNGVLPEPRFKLTRARTFRGKLVYKIRRKLLKTENYDFEMRMSVIFDLPQPEWEDVVIHEMIHLFIAVKNLKDSSSHGPVFRKMMNDINRTHSRNIKISTRQKMIADDHSSGDKRVKAHFICIAKFCDGRYGIAPVAKTRIFQLWDYFYTFPGIEARKWIGSTNPWFNQIPHVKKPKFFIFKREEILLHLKGGRPMERFGNKIHVINRHYSPDELLP